MTKYRHLLIGLLSMIFIVTARAEQIEDPQYTSWASHKAGTSVTYHSTNVLDSGNALAVDIKQTLKEITPDKVVIEVVTSMDIAGVKQERTQTQTIAAKIEKGEEALPRTAGGKSVARPVGKETITIAGKPYECTVMEVTSTGPRNVSTGKSWITVEIPGSLARLEMNIQSPVPGKGTMNVTAVEIK